MKMDWRWRFAVAIFIFAVLLFQGKAAQAQHAWTRDPYTGETWAPQLLSSSMRHVVKAADTCTVVPSKELFITDLSVVEDCYRTSWSGSCQGTLTPATRGAWSFGKVMEGVFNTTDQKKLAKHVRQWLRLWEKDQIVNGELVEARRAMRDLVLKPWEKASHGEELDMKKAPFRLLALVFRMDIGGQPITATFIDNAGQFRAVYGVLDEHGNPTPFTLIFEYQLEAKNCQEILGWVQNIHALSSYEFGPQYNAALQGITDRIITRGAQPAFLNGSALLAVRTNEAFLDNRWEMRSFALAMADDDDDDDDEDDIVNRDHDGGGPSPELLHQFHPLTPATHYQKTQVLGDFLVEFAPAILGGLFKYPLTYRGEPFLAGVAHNDLDLGWHGPEPVCTATPRGLQRVFSSFTCQGCHGKDTETVFLHVAPRRAGEVSQLSKMLTGPLYTVRDDCDVLLRFSDLERRRNFQCFINTLSCPQP
jgi:hypothetical protein